MNQASPKNDLRAFVSDDLLDRALSDYFKCQMRQPWPSPPATQFRVAGSEPASLRTERNSLAQETHQTQAMFRQSGVSFGRDPLKKSRTSLALSVAILLGSCWLVSSGIQPVDRGNSSLTSPDNSASKMIGVLPDSRAENPAVLMELRQQEAEHGNPGGVAPKIKLP